MSTLLLLIAAVFVFSHHGVAALVTAIFALIVYLGEYGAAAKAERDEQEKHDAVR